jgi:hypothetical protein
MHGQAELPVSSQPEGQNLHQRISVDIRTTRKVAFVLVYNLIHSSLFYLLQRLTISILN